MHSRRSRPTLRLLEEDLSDDWRSPYPRRCLSAGDTDQLHPLSELPHPIILKAAEAFPHEAGSDNPVGPITASTHLPLQEIKSGQWRGGVWCDPDSGVNWLIVAGLAKGGHQDRDDFYERVKREDDDGDPTRWLPTAADDRLLRQETAARLLTEWELTVQHHLLDALHDVQAGGSTQVHILHPIRATPLASLTLTVVQVREPNYTAEEILLDIEPVKAEAGTNLMWSLTIRALTSINPPEQGWDRYLNSYSTIADPRDFAARVAALEHHVTHNELAQSRPGDEAHYAHREHLAGSTINGDGVRAMCGVYFVPTQNHERMPCCPECARRFEELPAR